MENNPPPDSNDVQQMMQQMLAQNATAAEALVTSARTEREAAAAEREAAAVALQNATRETETLRAEFYTKHCSRIEKDIREQVAKDLAIRLLRAGESTTEVAALLDMPDPWVDAVAQNDNLTKWDLSGPSENRKKIGDSYAWVEFENQGRGGNVIFHLGKTILRFWYEFAGGQALVLIDAPTEEQWEAQTQLPLSLRMEVLQFIGRQAVAQHAPGHRYRIEFNSIVIY